MKTLALLAIAFCIGSAAAFSCTINQDCRSGTLSCANGYHPACIHTDCGTLGVDTDGGSCTCTPNTWRCTTDASQCPSYVLMGCLTQAHRHCDNGYCVCTNW